jgi:hypothetical protein
MRKAPAVKQAWTISVNSISLSNQSPLLIVPKPASIASIQSVLKDVNSKLELRGSMGGGRFNDVERLIVEQRETPPLAQCLKQERAGNTAEISKNFFTFKEPSLSQDDEEESLE